MRLKYFNYMIEDIRKNASQETLDILDKTCSTQVITDESMVSLGLMCIGVFVISIDKSTIPEREQIAISAIVCGYGMFINSIK